MPLPEAAFDVVIDSGVFHSFDDDARQRYLTRLRSAIRPGGHYFLLCFSELQPGDWGPRRVHGDELVTAFADGWVVRRMERSVFEINPLPEATEVQAWFVEAQAH
jgi:SAM-dependent methyltransferase